MEVGTEQAEQDERIGSRAAHLVWPHRRLVRDDQLVQVMVLTADLVACEDSLTGPDEDRVDAGLDQCGGRTWLERQPFAAELRRAVENPRLLRACSDRLPG